MDLIKRHATGWTIILFLLGVIGLSAAPLPSWLQPIDALAQDRSINNLWTSIFRRPDPIPRKGDAAAADWAVAGDDSKRDVEQEAPRPELEIVHPAKRPRWVRPERAKLDAFQKRLNLVAVSIENNCGQPAGSSDSEGKLCERRALDRFFTRLAALADDGGSSAPPAERIVRIVHYGDSIIASDHITDLVRQRLQERFGSAGKGFLLVGRYNARQRRLRTGDSTKGWRAEHIALGKVHDRFFGYTGASFTAETAGAETVFTDVGENRRVDVYYLEQPGGGTLEIYAGDALIQTLETGRASGPPSAKFVALTLPEHTQKLRLRAKTAAVRLFGVSLEAEVPGVIYESIGIPGATSAAWLYPDEDGFRAQLQHRNPALIVTMLGGNDARALHQKRTTIKNIEASTRGFLARLQASAPDADCLVVSPPDAVEAKASGAMKSRPEVPKVIAVQEEVAAEMGCAFWDMYESMGGSGSLEKWIRADLISPDLIHPKGPGADLLGELMAEALMNAYDASMAEDGEPESGASGSSDESRAESERGGEAKPN